MNNLGYLLYEGKLLAEALVQYEEAKALFIELLPTNPTTINSYVGGIVHNMGLCYEAQGELHTAYKTFEAAIRIRRKLVDKAAPATSAGLAQSLNSYGNVLTDLKQWQPGLDAYQEAFQVRAQLSSVNPISYTLDFTETLINLGVFFLSMAQEDPRQEFFTQAAQHLKNAVTLLQKHPPTPKSKLQLEMAQTKIDFLKTADIALMKLDKALAQVNEAFTNTLAEGGALEDILPQVDTLEKRCLALTEKTKNPTYLHHFSWVLEAVAPTFWKGEQLIQTQEKIISWRQAAWEVNKTESITQELGMSWSLLGSYLLSETDRYEEAVKASQKAIPLYPDQQWMLLNLAVAYIMTENTVDALEGIWEIKDLPYEFEPEKLCKEVLMEELRGLAEQGKINHDTLAFIEAELNK